MISSVNLENHLLWQILPKQRTETLIRSDEQTISSKVHNLNPNIIDQKLVYLPAPKPRQKYPYFVSSSVRHLHDNLYRETFNLTLNEGLFFISNSRDKECNLNQAPFIFKGKEELREVFDFNLKQKRINENELVECVKKILKYSPHPGSAYKLDRHGAGLDPYGLVGDWLGTIMSANVVTYSLAPVFTLMEYQVQRRVRQLIYGSEEGDGMLVPGIGAGNSYAIQCALQRKFLQLKEKGLLGLGKFYKPVLFVSEHGPFYYDRFAIWEGIGIDGVIRVRTNSLGQMDVNDLDHQIMQAKIRGQTPFMVVGTTGGPIFGAIDPLDQIEKLTSSHEMWFHVDGQLAGSVFLSEKQKFRINGIEKSDSFVWSVDKGLGAPYVTTVLVTREANVLKKTFSFGSDVVFKASPLYNSSKWDNGDHTLQTSRRPDILKVWFMWKAKGRERLAQHIDYTYMMTDYAVKLLKERSLSFKLILPEFESNQIAFYYIPSALHFLPNSTQKAVLTESKFTERLKVDLLRRGVLTISVNTLPDSKFQFFVMNLGNSLITEKHIDNIVDQIEFHGESLQATIFNKESFCLQLYLKLQSQCISKCTRPVINPDEGKNLTINVSLKTSKVFTESWNQLPKKPPEITQEVSHDFVNSPVQHLHGKFLQKFLNFIIENATYYEEKKGSEPVVVFKTPEELQTLFDFSLPDSIAESSGTMDQNEEELMNIIKNIIKYSAHYAHPYYNFHLAPAMDPYTIMADYLIAAINSPMITYEDSPAFTIMEEELTKAVGKLIGYPEDGEGLVLPGGSAGNQLAFHLAYSTKNPEALTGGVVAVNKTMVCFVSHGSHYSTHKAAFFGGVGLENVIHVEVDERGRMCSKDLVKKVTAAIDEGKVPFLVVATTGTTVFGAFDPIDEIGQVCEKYKMWFHVDGSYGGATIFSSNINRKHMRFRGIERSDSFTLNPHKVFGSIRESTVTVIRRKGLLSQISPPASDQEFNNEILYNGKEEDPGVKQLFPERRANVFKMWFLWKAKGMEGLGEHVDYGYNLTMQVFNYLKYNNETFMLVHPNHPPECTSVSFHYVPKRLRGTLIQDATFWKEIEQVQVQILRSVFLSGKLVISLKPFGNLPAFIVLPLYNSALTFEDVKYMLNVIDYYGNDL